MEYAGKFGVASKVNPMKRGSSHLLTHHTQGQCIENFEEIKKIGIKKKCDNKLIEIRSDKKLKKDSDVSIYIMICRFSGVLAMLETAFMLCEKEFNGNM